MNKIESEKMKRKMSMGGLEGNKWGFTQEAKKCTSLLNPYKVFIELIIDYREEGAVIAVPFLLPLRIRQLKKELRCSIWN
ncbi:MAG: hypothetical protein ACI35R_09480 [Bacillus sp. (in: firmicutes)]